MSAVEQIRLLAVVGPTASGKTAVGVDLAQRFGGEVVSADSMQIYRFLSISTARPTEEEMQGIPHHLVGFLDPDESYSVARYLDDARRVIGEIASRGKLPILVGGTGLYISSLLDGLRFAEEEQDPALREKLYREAERYGGKAMLERLREIDPAYAETMHPNNLGRILRALELYEKTGVTMTEQRRRSREAPSGYAPVIIGLDYRDRALLYDRIDRRVAQMEQDGLIEEAKAFYARWPDPKTAAQAIGCKELLPFLRGECSKEACLDRLRMETRRYAKRQRTWFRRDARVRWFYPDDYADREDLLTAVRAYVTELL